MGHLRKFSIYPFAVITLCGMFLFYKFVLQNYPGIINEQLMQEFSLTGAGLGNLAATFYYTYVVTQLFVGVLLDKYSIRWITSGAIICCAVGVVLFAQSHTLWGALLSRALMGVGVAFATVAYMKFAAVLFKPKYYAFIGGLLVTAAMAGAVFGQAPLSWFVFHLGWRTSLMLIGGVGFILAMLFFIIVRPKNPNANIQASTSTPTHITSYDIITVLTNPQNWLLCAYSGLAWAPIAIFGGLWGNPFIQEAYQISKTETASLISMIFIGMGIGAPLIGFISDKLGNRRYLMMICTAIAAIALSLVLFYLSMPLYMVGTLLFVFGFMLGAFMLVFAVGKEVNNPLVTATAIALLNSSDPVITGISETGIGVILDWFWDGTIVNGAHYFSVSSYQIALSVLPVFLITSTLILFWVREKPASKI